PAVEVPADGSGSLVLDVGLDREVDHLFGDRGVDRLVERDEARQRGVVFGRGGRGGRGDDIVGGAQPADRSAESEKRDRDNGGPSGHGGVPVPVGGGTSARGGGRAQVAGGKKRRIRPAEPVRRRFSPAMARLVGLSTERAERAKSSRYG